MTDRRLLLRAFIAVAVTRAALSILPARFIVRMAAKMSSAHPGPRTKGLDALRITSAVGRASRRVPGATCLTQALAAHVLLRKHGHRSRLCLDVARTEEGDFRPHPWLESQGRIVIDPDGVAKLTRLPDLPRNSRFTPSQGSK